MNEIILFIVEGDVAEPDVLDSMWHFFLRKNTKAKYHITYGSNIYNLWKHIDGDEDLDIIDVLVELNPDKKKELESIKRRVEAVYLFFDYEGHDPHHASDDDLSEMLDFFNDDEPSRGMLYISYPMVEALRHNYPNKLDFQNLTVSAKENIGYKDLVDKESKYKHVNKFDGPYWDYVCSINLRKAATLVSGNDEIPEDPDELSQILVFEKQLEKHIKPSSVIAVLSAFPLFIYQYIGNGILSRFKKK